LKKKLAKRGLLAKVGPMTTNHITCISQINSLEIIRALAAQSFNDKAVVSVIIQAAWGEVEVLRDGTVRAPKR
jgi:hypothetical protein